MGPFLSAILAAFVAAFSIDTAEFEPTPEGLEGAICVLGALAAIAAAGILGRVGGARRHVEGLPVGAVGGFERLFDLAAFVGLLRLTPWAAFVRDATPFDVFDVPVAFVPYFAAVLARHAGALGAGPRAIDPSALSRAVAFQGRLTLAPVAPIFLLTALQAGLDAWPVFKAASVAFRQLDVAATVVGLLLVTAVAPPMFRSLFGAKPLRDPELRADCEAFLKRARFKIDYLGEVATRGAVVNAVYLGLTRPFRTVLFTDALLAKLGRAERLAVFAHEVGHGARRHIAYMAAAIATLSVGTYAFVDDVAAAAKFAGAGLGSLFGEGAVAPTETTILALYAVVAPVFGLIVLLGYVSRRFETEADLFAAETSGDPESFIAALENVAAVAGPAALRDGFRHFGVPKRIAIIRATETDPAERARWRRTFRRIRIVVACAAVASAARLIAPLPGELETGRFRYESALVQLVDPEEREAAGMRALASCREATADPATKEEAISRAVAVLFALFDDAMREGDYATARSRRDAWTNEWPSGDPIGDFNRVHADAQLAALDGDAATARKTAADDLEALGRLDALIAEGKIGVEPRSKIQTEREIRFLAALADVEPPTPAAKAIPSGRVWAALVAPEGAFSATAAREAFDELRGDDVWRRDALARAVKRRFGADVEEALRAKYGAAWENNRR